MALKTLLNDSPIRLIRRFRLLLIKHRIPVTKIILFGSRAGRRARAWSDIDLCVVSPSFKGNRFEEMVRLKHLARTIEPLIEPIPMNPAELNDPFDPLAAEIRKHGRIIR